MNMLTTLMNLVSIQLQRTSLVDENKNRNNYSSHYSHYAKHQNQRVIVIFEIKFTYDTSINVSECKYIHRA